MAPTNQILTVAQMRDAEQALIDGGATVGSLMQAAGQGAADWIWRIAAREPVTVLCGPGNNGGDGYVIAETLRARGTPVTVVAPIQPMTDAARNAKAAFKGDVTASDPGRKGAVFVDCLFGSGLNREVADELAELLCSLASSHRYRVAVDLPSGIESDSGALLADGLPQFDLCLALGAWKSAHFLMPAIQYWRDMRLIDIGVGGQPDTAQLNQQPRLFAPQLDEHKYTRGLIAIVGGEMPGAALLAAQAAAHAGAGYVQIFSPEKQIVPPWIVQSVTDTENLEAAPGDRRISAILVGPGLGRGDAAKQRLAAVLRVRKPVVLDGDALTLLTPSAIKDRREPLIVTPHEGELAQLEQAFALVGSAAGTKSKSKPERIRALAQAMNAVVIGKGADTIICAGICAGMKTIFSPAASSWLSAAGTGDVLAGIVAARMAVRAMPGYALGAASEAVWLHGEAARLAGPVFTASELAAQLPRAYAACL